MRISKRDYFLTGRCDRSLVTLLEHLDHEARDLATVLLVETTRRHRRRTETDARRVEWRTSIARYRVLIERDAGPIQEMFRFFP